MSCRAESPCLSELETSTAKLSGFEEAILDRVRWLLRSTRVPEWLSIGVLRLGGRAMKRVADSSVDSWVATAVGIAVEL